MTTQNHDVGFDGNKKIKGRKRHTLVDTLGLLLAVVVVVVTAAHVDDRQGFVTLLETYLARGARRLRKIGVDQGYEAQWLKDWAASLKQTHKIDVEVVERQGQGFQVEPYRWKVERTFLCICNDRRNCRDYEVPTCNNEAMIQISTIRMLLKQLIQSGDSSELAPGLPCKGKSVRNRGVSQRMPFLVIHRSLLRGGLILKRLLSAADSYLIRYCLAQPIVIRDGCASCYV